MNEWNLWTLQLISINIKVKRVLEYSAVRKRVKIHSLERKEACLILVISSWLWLAATKSLPVLCIDTLISDRVLLKYGGQGLEVRISQFFLGSIMLPLHRVTLENHSLFVLLCPYGDEKAEKESFLPPSHISVCF